MDFLKILVYVTLMATFIFGTAFLMAAGLWYFGIPVFILGVSTIIYTLGL